MSRATPVIAVGLAAIALGAAALISSGDDDSVRAGAEPASARSPAAPRRSPAAHYPSKAQIEAAKSFAASRSGSVAFAVIGPDIRAGRGRRATTSLHGINPRMQFSSASVTKSMLLAGFLRTHKHLSGAAKGELAPMIQVSDNDAADAVYAQVGDEGLRRVARRAGMRDFEPTPGFWGGAQITAADMARFFYRLEDNLGKRHRRFGMRLLSSIVSYERWGIPEAAGKGWAVWFKGGWRPGGEEQSSGAVSHQAALLKFKDGTRISIAVLTNEAPGEGGGYSTIEGIADRLARPAP